MLRYGIKHMNTPHVPVLLTEVLQAFEGCHLKIFVDGTLGAGGHSAAILEAHPEIELLVGIDQDPTALEIARKRLLPWKEKARFIHSNFSHMKTLLDEQGIQQVNGILLDLGVSSMQFDQPEKGFSFMHEGPLDMRMNPKDPLTAADIVNTWSEQDLGRIFREYGEEKQWRQAARVIVSARNKEPILTTKALADILRPLFTWKKKGINPLTLIFQALRICVNKEIEVLEKVLPQAIDLLDTGGRLAVISFHSLEDRVVKNTFRYAADDKLDTSGIGGMFIDKDPTVSPITRKPVSATEKEVEANPRSRSAKLRAIEKL
jgi:16S rRNA (cytosine1402-N4)-methyltransferase